MTTSAVDRLWFSSASLGVVGVLGLLSVAGSAQAQWQSVATGVDYQLMNLPGPRRAHVTRVDLCAPGVRMRATAPGEGPATPSAWASGVGAHVATNADWSNAFGFQSLPSGYPRGLAVGDHRHFQGSRDPNFYGTLMFGFQRAEHLNDEAEIAAPEPWMQEVVSGQPTVIWNGARLDRTGGHCDRNPRTVTGLTQDRTTFFFVVVDGRSTSSIGMTCNEASVFLESLGAHSALIQDGGGSSAMYVAGRGVVNRPSDGSERSVTSHLGVIASGSGPPRSCVTREIPTPADGVLRHVPNPESFNGWRMQLADVQVLTDAQIDAYPRGAPWPQAGPALIRGPGPAVFVRDGDTKRGVPSPYAMSTWRFDWNAIRSVSQAELDAVRTETNLTPTPVLVRGSEFAVYVIDRRPRCTPSAEVCGGGDEDCDGRTDEGCATPEDAGGGEDAGAPTGADAGSTSGDDGGGGLDSGAGGRQDGGRSPGFDSGSAGRIDAGTSGGTLAGGCSVSPRGLPERRAPWLGRAGSPLSPLWLSLLGLGASAWLTRRRRGRRAGT